MCSRPVVGDCMVSSGRLVCQVLLVGQSLHLFINQVLPQAVHDLLCVRGQPQWHLLHLPQQAHLREGLQRECAELKFSQYLVFMQTAAECAEDVQRVRVPDLGRVLHPGQRQGGVRGGLQGNIPTLSTVITDNTRQKTLDICKKCSRPVEGKLVKLSGSVYHPQCFSCQVRSHEDQG